VGGPATLDAWRLAWYSLSIAYLRRSSAKSTADIGASGVWSRGWRAQPKSDGTEGRWEALLQVLIRLSKEQNNVALILGEDGGPEGRVNTSPGGVTPHSGGSAR
jgi:hypothetical protein